MVSRFQLNRNQRVATRKATPTKQKTPPAQMKQAGTNGGNGSEILGGIDPETIFPLDDDPDFAEF